MRRSRGAVAVAFVLVPMLGAFGASTSCSSPAAPAPEGGAEAAADAPGVDEGVDAPSDAPLEARHDGDIPLRVACWSATRAPEYNLPAGAQVKSLRGAILDVFDVAWAPLTSLDVGLASSNADGVVLTTYAGTFGTISPALDANEQAALRAFVDAGHFAILLLDNDGYGGPIDPYNDSLARPLGLDAIGTLVPDGGYASAMAVVTDAGVHPIAAGVPSFPQYFPGWLAEAPDGGASMRVVAENASGPALVVLEKGILGPSSGIVVAFSDTGSFTDDAPAGLTPAAQKVFVQALRYAAGK